MHGIIMRQTWEWVPSLIVVTQTTAGVLHASRDAYASEDLIKEISIALRRAEGLGFAVLAKAKTMINAVWVQVR